MSLPWSAQQLEWLREMGFDVLARRDGAAAAAPGGDVAGASDRDAPLVDPATADAVRTRPAPAASDAAIRAMRALERVASGVDLGPLLAAGLPRDPASRRAFWRALRPLRKAARAR